MAESYQNKKQMLEKGIPECLLINRAWLEQKGFTRPDIDYYLRSASLQTVKRGLYRKPGAQLKWQHIAYSLQELGFASHIGGKTALAEKGLAHYLEFGNQGIQVFSHEKLPAWLVEWQEQQNSAYYFSVFTKTWLANVPDQLYSRMVFGNWDWPIKIARPELAIVEWVNQAKTTSDLQAIDSVFEGLTTLSPRRLQAALELCTSIQTRRLMGWFCDRHPHTWSKRIAWQTIELGTGKRAFIKAGVYNAKWQITVPTEMEMIQFTGYAP